MILHEIAQDIVNQTMQTIPYNINIMDSEGVIVASGRPERIGTFHERAYEVVKSGLAIETYKEDLKNKKNIEPGISLPIIIENRTIGSVGITGNPEEVRVFGELLKHTVELMLKQTFMKDRIYYRQVNKIMFMQDLLTGRMFEDGELLYSRAKEYGINLQGELLLLTAEVAQEKMIEVKKKYYAMERFESLLDRNVLNSLHIGRESINPCMIGNYLSFLVTIEDKTGLKEIDFPEFIAQKTYDELKKNGYIDGSLCFSELCINWMQLPQEYDKNIKILRFDKKRGRSKASVISIKQHMIDFIAQSIDPDIARHLTDIFKKGTYAVDHQRTELKQTLACYYENNKNIEQTAKALYIHRNTLRFRLDKIKELTGLDPRQFEDAVILYFALRYCDSDNTLPDACWNL